MAINPLSAALTGANLPDAAPAPKPQTATPPPTLQQLQAVEGATLDPMLIDSLSGQNAAQTGPLMDSFASMTGGNPQTNANDPAGTEDAALNQELTSFFIQQATGFYNASQLLGTIDPSASSSALGNTTA